RDLERAQRVVPARELAALLIAADGTLEHGAHVAGIVGAQAAAFGAARYLAALLVKVRQRLAVQRHARRAFPQTWRDFLGVRAQRQSSQQYTAVPQLHIRYLERMR
ncbi:intracellular serine protease, partial [Corchorus olitorius]